MAWTLPGDHPRTSIGYQEILLHVYLADREPSPSYRPSIAVRTTVLLPDSMSCLDCVEKRAIRASRGTLLRAWSTLFNNRFLTGYSQHFWKLHSKCLEIRNGAIILIDRALLYSCIALSPMRPKYTNYFGYFFPALRAKIHEPMKRKQTFNHFALVHHTICQARHLMIQKYQWTTVA
jgi:hypothetical protein